MVKKIKQLFNKIFKKNKGSPSYNLASNIRLIMQDLIDLKLDEYKIAFSPTGDFIFIKDIDGTFTPVVLLRPNKDLTEYVIIINKNLELSKDITLIVESIKSKLDVVSTYDEYLKFNFESGTLVVGKDAKESKINNKIGFLH